MIVGVCPATPVGITRFLSWIVEARRLAPFVPVVVAVNRAPSSRFRRGELYEELTRSLPPCLIEFIADDRRVTDAAWDGRLVANRPVHAREWRDSVRLRSRSRAHRTSATRSTASIEALEQAS